jgi:hypothetical protein
MWVLVTAPDMDNDYYPFMIQRDNITYAVHEQSSSESLLIERKKRKALYQNNPTAHVFQVTDVTEMVRLRYVPRYNPITGKVEAQS